MSDEEPDGDREGDPFDHLGGADDREGDPFESLGDGESATGTDTNDPSDDSDDAPSDAAGADGNSEWFDDPTPGPTDRGGGPASTPGDGADDSAAPDSTGVESATPGGPSGESDPVEDQFAGVQREGDPFEAAESAFERMDVGDVDPDSVWETLGDAQMRGSVSRRQGRTYAEVSKHRFCEQCEYFSVPPDIECSHEGTEIIEFLDVETVRVVDCPVVAERRELEEQE